MKTNFPLVKLTLDQTSNYILLGIVTETMIRNNELKFIKTSNIPSIEEVIGLGLVFKTKTINELIDIAISDIRNKMDINGI